jgi:hypothetical protein
MKNPQLKPEIAQSVSDAVAAIQKLFFEESQEPPRKASMPERVRARLYYVMYDVFYWITYFVWSFFAGIIDGVKDAVGAVNVKRDV